MELIRVSFEALRRSSRVRYDAVTLAFPFRPYAVMRNPRLLIPHLPRLSYPALMGSASFLPTYAASIPMPVRESGKVLSMKRYLMRSGNVAEARERSKRIGARDFRLALRYLTERKDKVGNVMLLPFVLEAENEEKIKQQDFRFFRRTDWWAKN